MPLQKTVIDEYISNFPKEVQAQLNELKASIRKAAPEAEETINYGMPTFKLFGNLVHFAGYKNHIGFYPAPSGIVAFQKELSAFNTSKGAIQFPIGEPLPIELISQIVQFRVAENTEKNSNKKKTKTCPNGHKFTKSSDCPVCPLCEKNNKAKTGFLSELAAPARRALEGKNISTLHQLAKYSEQEIAALHGMGPSTIKKLKVQLSEKKLSFKK